MKKIILGVFFITPFFLWAQSSNCYTALIPAAKLQVRSAYGSNPYTLNAIVYDDFSRFTISNFAAGDSVYMIEGSYLLSYVIQSISGNTIVVYDPRGSCFAPPTGQGAIIKPTSKTRIPVYVSGLREDLRAMIMNRQAEIVDDYFKNLVDMSTNQDSIFGHKTFQNGIDVVGGANNAALNVNGVQSASVVSITADTTLNGTFNSVIALPQASTITISLPTPNTSTKGWSYKFIKGNANAGSVKVKENSTAFSLIIYSNNISKTIKCDGARWYLE